MKDKGLLKSLEARLSKGRSLWLTILLCLLAGSMTGYAQSNCFTYEDMETKTIIKGLTETGQAATSLEIPKEVTAVRSGAFTMATTDLAELYIENGGNPTFELGLFGENANTLTKIDMGDGMSVANMIALLQSVGTIKENTTIEASGFTGVKDISNATWSAVTWTNVLSITLPAELIGEQQFGNAEVYGRFNIAKEIITFCGSATFQDIDDGSNQLFYVANYKAEDGRLHIKRVRFIVADEGVLIHRNSDGYADLPRYSGAITTAEQYLYTSNMLKGVTSPTSIESTGGTKTNYILKDGAFHPTTGGTVKANKAYLQIPTAQANAGALTIDFGDETTEIRTTDCTDYMDSDAIYDLSGRRVAKPTKGLYINNGKKYVIR